MSHACAIRGVLSLLLLAAAVGEGVRGADSPPSRTDRNGDPLPEGAIARLGTLRFRHGAPIHALAFSPDSKTLATGGEGDVICLWDTATGKARRRLTLPGMTSALAYSPDGKLLASANEHGEVVSIFEADTGKRVYEPNPDDLDTSGRVDLAGSPGGIAFAPDGKRIAWCTGEAICFLDVTGRKTTRTLTADRMERFVVYLPDGKSLAAADRQGNVILFDAKTGKRIRQLGESEPLVRLRTAAVSPDGNALASGYEDGTVWIVDLLNGAKRRVIQGHPGGVHTIAFTPNGKRVFAASRGRVCLWDLASEKPARELVLPRHGETATLSPDGKLVATGGVAGTVRVRSAETGEEACPFEGHADPVNAVTFSPDGRSLVSGGEEALLAWDVVSRKVVRRFRGRTEAITGVACSPDGKLLATGHWTGAAQLWNVQSGERVREVGDQSDSAPVLSFGANGDRLATGQAMKKIYHIWDVANGERVRTIQDEVRRGFGVARFGLLSPDGRYLATGGLGEAVQLHNLTAAEKVVWCPRTSPLAAAFSPDGKHFATGYKDIWCWEPGSDRESFRLERLRGDVSCLAFSPDGRLLAAAIAETNVRVYEVATGSERCRFIANPDGVRGLAFSPDNRTFATAGPGETIVLWDVLGAASSAVDPPALRDGWDRLAMQDAGVVHNVLRRMIADPGAALPFLKARLQFLLAVDAKRVARLIRDLDNDGFETRERATRELATYLGTAGPALREAAANSPSTEVRRRATALLENLDERVPSGERLRMVRAVEVLERIGNAESRRLLEDLARGGIDARLTREAKAAVQRLAKNPGWNKP